MDRQRMDTVCEFRRQRRIDHAVAVDPAPPAERFGHDMDAKMGFAARPVPGMAGVPVGFVLHLKALRRESLGQLLGDLILHRHDPCLRKRCRRVNLARRFLRRRK
jgi:hypothetical protein